MSKYFRTKASYASDAAKSLVSKLEETADMAQDAATDEYMDDNDEGARRFENAVLAIEKVIKELKNIK